MIKNWAKWKFIRLIKKDIIGNLAASSKLTCIKLFLFNLYKKKEYPPNYFFRIGFVDKPVYTRRKTFFYKYFIKIKQFRLFYNGIKINQFKKIVKKCIQRKNSVNWFIYFMESRLDILLFRLNLVSTVRMARQYILHGKVLVNGKVIKTPGYNLKENEILTVIPGILSEIKNKIFEKISSKNFLIYHTHLNYIECLWDELLFIFTKINIFDVKFFFKSNFFTFASLINFYRKTFF